MRNEIFERPIFHLVLIAILGLLIYSNTFDASFHFDDFLYIKDNPLIKDFVYFLEPSRVEELKLDDDVTRFFKTRRVGYFTLWASHRLGGLDVTGYHVVNLSLHLINALLVYLIVVLTFMTPLLEGSRLKEHSRLIALFSGLLFVAHPLQTETVTYIIKRVVLLASMFYLASTAAYIGSRLSKGKGRYSLYALALLFAVLGMKTKENVFTLPVAIGLYEFMFFRDGIKKRALFLVPLLLTMLIIPLTYIDMQKDATFAATIDSATRYPGGPDRMDYLYTQLNVVAKYLGLLFIPAGQNVDHDQPVLHSFFEPQVVLSSLLLVSVLGIGVYCFRRSRIKDNALRIVSFGIFWFFLALSVESSVLPIAVIMVEYRVYLPSAGFHIAAAAGTFLLIGGIRNKVPAYTSLVLVLIVLAFVTYTRNTVWKSDIALWEDTVEKSPEKARPHVGLGVAILAKYGMQNAIEQFKEALRIDPGCREANLYIGSNYLINGMPEEAIEHFKLVAKSDPYFADPYVLLGKAYLEMGNIKEAEKHYWKALKLNPKDVWIHFTLGIAYQSEGMVDKAIEHYRTAAELEPRDPTSYYNLGIIYQSRGLMDNAIQLYLIALEVAPNYAEAHNNLGVAYRSKGMADKAIEHYRIALELIPDYAQAHYNLGLVYLDQGLEEEARGEFEAALRIDPGYVKARESLDGLDGKQQI
jgi:tetratricopeptide (TPR) repeat protein